MLCVLVLLLASCTSEGSDPDAADPSARGLNGRPLRPVPDDVRPAGFTTPPPGAGLSRYQQQPLDWEPCDKQLQCAKVLVPLDYGAPDGTAITLALTRKPATGKARRGSLFLNPGGPGGSGIDFVSSFRRQGLEDYDLVGWDPRGVGQSTPVQCGGADFEQLTSMDNSPDSTVEETALLEADRQLGLQCLQESGPLLEHISTVETARDLDLLRGLVEDDKLNFFGASYGTRIGATYAQLFPGRVGRLVLDGAVNITDDDSVSQAQGFERALRAFADWCAGRQCALGSTQAGVLKTISTFWTGLDAEPLKVGTRRLTQQLAVSGVVVVLYGDQDAYKYLLQALQLAIKNQDGRALLFLADQLNDRTTDGKYGQLNYAFPAIRCRDDRDEGIKGETSLAAAAADKAPTIGPFVGPDLVCPMWPVPAAAPLKLVAPGAPPIVVIGTTGDPATPYEYAVSMAEQLRSGVLVTYKGVGHTAYGSSACVQKLVVSYLDRGVVPKDGTTC